MKERLETEKSLLGSAEYNDNPRDPNFKVKENSIAEQMLILANDIRQQALQLNSYIEEKLAPIIIPDATNTGNPNQTTKEVQYPPLFDALRGNLQSIQSSLYSINSIVSRITL